MYYAIPWLRQAGAQEVGRARPGAVEPGVGGAETLCMYVYARTLHDMACYEIIRAGFGLIGSTLLGSDMAGQMQMGPLQNLPAKIPFK